MNMNPTTNETNEPINITPMTLDEARSCVAAIRSNLESLGAMLLDLERRRGWEALGYSSFRECAMAEFGKSQGYVYKLLHAASVDENLAASEIYPMDKSEIARIPTSHKEELHKLPDHQQAEALKKADVIAQAEGKSREVKHVRQVVKEYKSVARETAVLGESLGLPTQGDSVLPQSDRIDDLTHISPADVDDRPLAPPTQLLPISHKYNAGSRITTDYSLKGEVGKIVRVLDTSALVDWGSHTIEIPFERLRPVPAKQPNHLPHSYDSKDERESDSPLQSPPNLTEKDAFVPTPAQWLTAQVKHVELLQALRDAQVEIEQLTAENVKLREANGNLHNEIAQLKAELAAMKQQM